MDLRTAALLEVKEARELLALLPEEARAPRPLPAAVSGLSEAALLPLLAAACRTLLTARGRMLVLAKDAQSAGRLSSYLQGMGLPALPFLPREYTLYNLTSSHEAERGRLAALAALLSGAPAIVVTTAEAALGYTLPRGRLAALTLTLKVGDSLSPDVLCRILTEGGYLPVATVEAAGQFARRGGIVDFAPEDTEKPVRIEFFGDEIDRLGRFDPLSQRLTESLDSVTVLPAREVTADAAARERIAAEIRKRQTKLDDNDKKNALSAELAAVTAGLELRFADKYLNLVYPEGETLLSYFKEEKTPVALYLAREVTATLSDTLALIKRTEGELVGAGSLPARYASHADEGVMRAFLSSAFPLYLNTLATPPSGTRLSGLFGFSCRTAPSYADKESLLLSDLSDLIATGHRVVLFCHNDTEARERALSLTEAGFTARRGTAEDALPAHGEILLVGDPTPGGFILPSARVALLSLLDGDAAAEKAKKRRSTFRKGSGAGERILSYAELHEGDYVVHAQHGIGRFLGMQAMTVDGTVSDYITLQYAGNEKLFLRADKLAMVARYIGARDADGGVKLSRIGGAEWGRAKARAKQAAREMAKELIELYAKRSRLPGYAFPPEGALEAEFAASFEYEETEPQRIAIAEISADMSRPQPMDRLLCGDVGYGKTEVALRAAFRAVAAGKQVAILVPTTLLALQHYTTLLSRMRGYPVNVEMISRFRKPREASAILRRTARGEIDILVGTHSLLGKGVSFRDLGLLIVDEEQRFGVSQKEKIKQLAEGVDVLTLSATPIPRTLNMAMGGIRDMSVLDEPPSDRHPVTTVVMEHDDGMIAEAMRRELARGGQVLYLYNRVDTIHHVADKVARALPEARIAVGHGQMDKDELEGIWQSLVLGEVDILVATTIIEAGVDLPNANTLIIEDADRLGLAQLHQLRGRVGRSSRRAYAFCTYRPGKALTEIAAKRLEAIREYAEFGAGFRVALRDLEIRGAGNLLGPEQHGHIEAVGYDMYLRLLNEAVIEEKGEKPIPPETAVFDLSVDAHIPEDYVPSAAHRIDLYKKILLIRTEEDRSDVLDELCDRFGEPPVPVVRLLDTALGRAIGTECGMTRIEQRGRELRFHFKTLALGAWSEACATVKGLSMRTVPEPLVLYRLAPKEEPTAAVLRILSAYAEGLTTP